MAGNVLSVSWSRYQELLRTGRVAEPVYTDTKGIAWTLAVGNPVFDTEAKPDEAKITGLMDFIKNQRK